MFPISFANELQSPSSLKLNSTSSTPCSKYFSEFHVYCRTKAMQLKANPSDAQAKAISSAAVCQQTGIYYECLNTMKTWFSSYLIAMLRNPLILIEFFSPFPLRLCTAGRGCKALCTGFNAEYMYAGGAKSWTSRPVKHILNSQSMLQCFSE